MALPRPPLRRQRLEAPPQLLRINRHPFAFPFLRACPGHSPEFDLFLFWTPPATPDYSSATSCNGEQRRWFWGLFKSKQKRIDEGRRQQYLETVELLEQLDIGQRGAIALHCATIRLEEMGLFGEANPEVAEMARLAWYDPLQADDFTIKVTIERLAGKLHQAATQFIGAAGDRSDMSLQLVLVTAIKAIF